VFFSPTETILLLFSHRASRLQVVRRSSPGPLFIMRELVVVVPHRTLHKKRNFEERANCPLKLSSRRSVGPADEPPRAARDCSASWRAHIAPSEL
jgi:hypothetical protein